jgi:YggT family protein
MLTTLLAVLGRLIDLYSLLIVVYVLMSWFPTSQGILRDINEVLGKVCDPYLNIFKRIIPPIGMVDISPIFALIVLQLVARFL